MVDTRVVTRYNLFILQVLRGWQDPSVKHPSTRHHRGFGRFMVAGKEISLPSKVP